MNLSAYGKSIAATLLGAFVPAITAATTHGGTLTASDLITSLVTAVVSGGAVYSIPNTKKTAAGIIVTLKTDADKFLAVITAGLPVLVDQAATAAITPPAAAPAVVPPVTPPAA